MDLNGFIADFMNDFTNYFTKVLRVADQQLFEVFYAMCRKISSSIAKISIYLNNLGRMHIFRMEFKMGHSVLLVTNVSINEGKFK